MQNASAMKSSLFSRNAAYCFTDLTHLSKGNFPFNLDNTLSTTPITMLFKIPWLSLDRNNNYNVQSYTSKRRVFLVVLIKQTKLTWGIVKLHLLLYIRIKMYALNLLLFGCKSQHFVIITKIFPSRGSNVASH